MSIYLKVFRRLICLFIPVVCILLSSCAPGELLADIRTEFSLFQAEYGEIMQFFDKEFSAAGTPSVYAQTAEPDTPILPQLDALGHTEILDSPYVSGRWTVYDAGTSDVPREGRTAAGYVHVPLFDDRSAQAVLTLLRSRGIEADTQLRANPTPAGRVFAVRYAGFSDESGYYINPQIPVTLYVSDQKKAQRVQGRGENIVYLTYDDGPTQTDTIRLLDILDTYGVTASFFTTGEAVMKYPASAKAIADRGHTLACHSVTHQYEKIYRSTDSLRAEVEEWEAIVRDAGVTLTKKLFRFPGGSVGNYLTGSKAADMTAMLESMGYTVFDWNVVTNDSLLYLAEKGQSTYDYIRQTFIETFEACLKENASKENAPIILLMHETVPETVDLMPWMLEYLIGKGFVFGDLASFGSSWTFAER